MPVKLPAQLHGFGMFMGVLVMKQALAPFANKSKRTRAR